MKCIKMSKIILLAAALMLLLSGCGEGEKTVKIAVMGNPDNFYSGYKDGIERAVRDFNEAYNNIGYSVECDFYGDDSNYESGSAVIDLLAENESISAVIAGNDMAISKTAAHVFNSAGKLFVVPYFLYDSVYENNHYSTVFSLCNSANSIGKMLRCAAEQTTAKRWVVCGTDRELEKAEVNGFITCDEDDGIEIVDCVDISLLSEQFDSIYERWETLGVEGVVMFPPDKSGFEILKKLKKKNPMLICAGDSAFDDSPRLQQDKELSNAMNGFIIVDEFSVRYITEDEELLLNDMMEEQEKNSDDEFDTWYIQGYNAVRIIADTAVENHTVEPSEIAEVLHSDGYKGLACDFNFNENGSQIPSAFCYSIYSDEGYWEIYEVENG